ncbi:MAG: alpha-keto acid decarboxylase family protein [Methanosarcina flavescens]|jgi:indolepyruvate decarboxylase|uniref:Alpha-keto acid decarboxylase family protein n=1 Tax=Methanosarcina flavescens TaxID=1715806 RepID=A0A660HR06_9EURY|nr:alpha-keto acid decarboxylase family protein [Methanosarcina flavescens]AYK14698.1 alpha-keto acid decarboxylase family protein [Methanosarcina flavescens]
MPTVIQYLLGRLKQLGIRDIFGVPGDFAFPINNAICDDNELRWIGCCNELNAAYAADGYARINRISALSTTFGVGELSALCGIAGSYAENNMVFHIVGIPKMQTQKRHAIVHHSLGDGEYGTFMDMATPVVCASTMLTPENCVDEVERVIEAALENRQPVYIAIPHDYVNAEISSLTAPKNVFVKSDPATLEEVVSIITAKLSNAKQACIMPGFLVDRFGLKDLAMAVINASGLPYATMALDKAVLDETNPSYMGLYMGQLINPEIQEFVESCDCILAIGVVMSDINMGMFTAKLDKSRVINIMPFSVHIGNTDYINVKMLDVLEELSRRLNKRTDVRGPVAKHPAVPEVNAEDPITADYLYAKYAEFFKLDDIVVVDSTSSFYGLLPLPLPEGVKFLSQMLWGAIGWATPAAFGTALAAPDRRVILITGEGSHQMTVQEISQFYRYGLKPIIFVLNNHGYLIERMLSKKLDYCYNDIPEWQYHKLPEVLGCNNWITRKTTTCGDLDKIMRELDTAKVGAYIEIVTPELSAPPLMKAIHENL